MRPEAAHLLALCRADPAPRIPVDSDRLVDLARAQELGALAYWNWRCSVRLGLAPATLDCAAVEELKLVYLHHLLRNESLALDIEALRAALHERGIPALFFKGPLLAYEAYPDPGARPVGDLDVGIREGDYPGAVDALRCLGYVPDGTLPRSATSALRRAHYGEQLRFHARGRRMVELHFRMVNMGPPRDEDWVWRSSRYLAVGSTRVRVPAPTATLLHLALHANQHAFAVARIFFDVRYALDLGEIDWDRFLSEVRALRCATAVYHSLCLARDLAAAAIPPAVLDDLRPGALGRRRFRACWDVGRARRLEARRGRQEVESPKLYLLEVGRMRDKLRYVAGLVAEAGGPFRFVRRTLGHPARQAPRSREGAR